MKTIQLLIFITFSCLLFSCSSRDNQKVKGISLDQATQNSEDSNSKDKKPLISRPSNVLLTGHADHRLITVYKVNFDSKRGKHYIGSNYFHRSYSYDYYDDTNPMHLHFMPGIEALYGFNLINIAHYNVETKERKNLFENPVFINTLYYPSLRQDSLNNEPITRDYYLVSVYDEDTNKDSLINQKDLRRFYHFNLNGLQRTNLISSDYSVLSSEYDSQNDLMFIFARLDQNANGKREEEEPIHVFWVDLKEPKIAERLY